MVCGVSNRNLPRALHNGAEAPQYRTSCAAVANVQKMCIQESGYKAAVEASLGGGGELSMR